MISGTYKKGKGRNPRRRSRKISFLVTYNQRKRYEAEFGKEIVNYFYDTVVNKFIEPKFLPVNKPLNSNFLLNNKLRSSTSLPFLFALFFFFFVTPTVSFPQTTDKVTSWESVGNMYSQPNTHILVGRNALDYYGSGDVNDDEVIDQNDANSILGSTSDRADIDGDGTPGTQADKSKLVQYLNGEIGYLPAHWNKLQTKEERISWIEKTIKIQDMWPYIRGDYPWNQGPKHWVCANYIEQMQIDFGGISNIDEYIVHFNNSEGITYNGENNARFNLPFYRADTKNASEINHQAGGFFIGDGNSDSNNVLNFDNWYFVNYYQDKRLLPGEFDMNENEYARIGLRAYVEDPYEEGYFSFPFISNLVNLQNGEGTMIGYKDLIKVVGENRYMPFVILDNPNDDRVNVQSLEERIVNYEPNLTMTIPWLEAKGYNVMPDTTKENTILPIDMTYEYNLINENPNGFFSDWEFTTTGTISSGGVTNSGSGMQSVKVRDTEFPVIPYQGKITVLQEDFQDDPNAYSLNATDNTEITDSTKTLTLISEDETKKLYELRGEVTDLGGNVTEAKAIEIEVLKPTIQISKLEDKLINYQPNLDLSPNTQGKPTITTTNTTETPVYSFLDATSTILNPTYPEINYSFVRTHKGSVEDIADSSTQKLTIADIENPVIPSQNKLIVLEENFESDANKYIINATDNSIITDSTKTLNLISEDETKKFYELRASVTDAGGNTTEKKVMDIEVLKAGISISKLKDNLINYKINLNLTPDAIGKPIITIQNTQSTPTYIYKDSDTTILNQTYPKINYSFVRTHIGLVDNISDSTTQKITIADIEAPQNGEVPDSITLTEEQVEINGGLSPEITGGYVTGETDNSELPIDRVVVFTKISEDGVKEIYNAIHTSTDQFGNDTTYTLQRVSVIRTPAATIMLVDLDDEVLVNFQHGMSTDPVILGNLGYNAVPTAILSDTNAAYTLTFNDGDREILSEQFPEVNYKFERTFIGKLSSGEDIDTAKQIITIADIEKPVVSILEEITISRGDSLHPSVTGYPEITDNNAVKDTLFSYTLVTSSKTKEVYNAFIEVEDFFGNKAEDSLGNRRIKYQIVTRDLLTSIEEEAELPIEFKLYQNYPNPFNPSTTINYSIPVLDSYNGNNTNVVLKIYDILGKEVVTLVNKKHSAGNYSVKFNASKLNSGIYFYKLHTSNGFSETKKMQLIR